ncbi:MAG: hypothetical protein K8W52_24520 [Deltaproteobacteria bacterium]|nr:hypothetical protein [Deltaproteobacteria bacterium]
MTLQQIIADEFSRHYREDEVDIDRSEQLKGRAEASAVRLSAMVGSDRKVDLVALLRALQADRVHPLHAEIGGRSELWWADDDELFAVFQQLVDWILMGLAAPPSSTSP